MGFTLSRMYYLNWSTFSTHAAPGEFYYYRAGHYKVGIIMHLVGAIIGGFLASLQFIPWIRYKAILFHRINGYFTIMIFLIGIAGAFMVIQHAQGGSPDMQLWIGLFGSMVTIGLALAYINIKRLQIDQHRAWMLRTWTWAACIATQRLMLMAGMTVANNFGYVYYQAIRCAEIYYMYEHVGVPAKGNPTGLLYPTCNNVTDASTALSSVTISPKDNTNTFTIVSSKGSGPENAAALVRTMFIMGAWVALVIHVLVIEVYLWLTPAEHDRLRKVSYQRQVEAGMRPKGRYLDAGLTSATRIGDAPKWWSVPDEDYQEVKAHEEAHRHSDVEGLHETKPLNAVGHDHQNRSGSETEVESGFNVPGASLPK